MILQVHDELNFKCHHEEIEELKTEKNFLLRSLNCADDADISDVKKEIATLEIALKKLDEQE